MRALAADALRRHGFQVLTASTGTEALELAGRPCGPSMSCVTDVVMPQMGGQQLAEHLLAQHAGAEGAVHLGLYRQRPDSATAC